MSFDTQVNTNPSKSILIVDDNDMFLNLLEKGFAMVGMNVIKAGNGLDGWKLFNSNEIDVVLTDIRMPRLDGGELSRRIRNASPNTTIALMTGVEVDTARELLNDGTADHLFLKPFPLGFVCKALAYEAQMAS